MGKGSWRRPTGPAFDANYDRIFGRKSSSSLGVTDTVPAQREQRALVLTLDELRVIVFRTSVAYTKGVRVGTIQEAEWLRAAALRDSLEDLGFEREAEMIGGAG